MTNEDSPSRANESPDVLLKLYLQIRAEKLASSTRYYQVMALMITIIWGGFALFATQLDPKTDLGVGAITIASLMAVGFALSWAVLTSDTRDDEGRMDWQLKLLEDKLRVAWLFPEEMAGYEPHRIVKFFSQHLRVPLGMVVVGIGGTLTWSALLSLFWLIHFDLI